MTGVVVVAVAALHVHLILVYKAKLYLKQLNLPALACAYASAQYRTVDINFNGTMVRKEPAERRRISSM